MIVEFYQETDFQTEDREKLNDMLKMFRAICDSSSNAFLYYSFQERDMKGFGNWDHFFDARIDESGTDTFLYRGVEERYYKQLKTFIAASPDGEQQHSMEYYNQTKRIWIECQYTDHYDQDFRPLERVIRFRDVTRLRRQNEELSYMAYYDSLTGLYNRNYFVKNVRDWLKRAETENKKVSILFLDIDDFRKVNDGLGLIIGDELVQQVGQYLSSFSGRDIIVSHFNSDLYCIAVYAPEGGMDPAEIFEQISGRMSIPFVMTDGSEISITISVGVASYPEAGTSALELINNAEIVMFRAKHLGKGVIQYFDTPILNEFLNNIDLENRLKKAVSEKKKNPFFLYYQPQYDSRSGKLRGVEALIRWQDDRGKIISPSVFIPIAEKNGSIVSIGQWVLEESLSTFAKWKTAYQCPLVLSVNISAIQYKKKDFVERLMMLLKKYDLKPGELELEITESILIDDFDEIIAKMKQLREFGVRVSLDDFGTGYSSLSYLKGLPIDTLKIDKSFIDTLVTDRTTKIIMKSIVSMVKQLGFETVAEGVETAEQMAYLQQIDCDNIQGFLLGRPMQSSDVEELLQNQTKQIP